MSALVSATGQLANSALLGSALLSLLYLPGDRPEDILKA